MLYCTVQCFFLFFMLTGLGRVQNPKSNEKGGSHTFTLVLSFFCSTGTVTVVVAPLLNLSLRRYKTVKMIVTEFTQMLVIVLYST